MNNSGAKFVEFLRNRKKRNKTKNYLYFESGKLKKVLNIFIDKEKNYYNLDDFFAYRWIENFKIYRSGLIDKNSKNKLFSLVFKSKKILQSPLEINKILFSIKEKGDSCKEITSEKIYTTPWALQITSICVVALLFSITVCRFAPEISSELADRTDSILMTPISKVFSLGKFSKNSPGKNITPDNEAFSQFIIKNNNTLNSKNLGKINRVAITKGDLTSSIARAAESENKIQKNTKTYPYIKKNYSNFILYLNNFIDFLAEKQTLISNNLNTKFIDYLAR